MNSSFYETSLQEKSESIRVTTPWQAYFFDTMVGRSPEGDPLSSLRSKYKKSLDSYALRFHERIDNLPFYIWKRTIHGVFGYYLMKDETDKKNYALEKALKRLERYEQALRIHVLFMIAWKALCQIDIPSECKRSSFTFFSWTSEGWKKSSTTKQANLKSNDLHIILESVLPFVLEEDEVHKLAKLSSKKLSHKKMAPSSRDDDSNNGDNSNKRKRTG